MSGIIKRWWGYDYVAVSWEQADLTIQRLGFVHRSSMRTGWTPVAQIERLLPLGAQVGLGMAIDELVRYHELVGTIAVPVDDARIWAFWTPGGRLF